MSETKNRLFLLELTDKETKAFIDKCHGDGTTPAEVLEGFICDLTGAERTRGSDERMLAAEYYERCGYGFFIDDKRTFAQWLLNNSRIDSIISILDDIKTLEEDAQYLKEHPEESEDEEIECILADIDECKKEIEDLYQEYANQTKNPETLENGINGVNEYLNMIEDGIKEGGII